MIRLSNTSTDMSQIEKIKYQLSITLFVAFSDISSDSVKTESLLTEVKKKKTTKICGWRSEIIWWIKIEFKS